MKLDNLNEMQRQAVLTTEGPLLLLAGAGSGKTKVLTSRIAYLIEQGIKPYNILAITFTNKAAKEMKERVEALTGMENAVWVSTFHSTCVRILRRHIDRLGYSNHFTIYDSDDSERLVRNTMKEVGLNDKQFTPKAILAEIGRQKDELIDAEEFEEMVAGDFRRAKIGQVYKLYQSQLKANNALDFDDLIFKTVRLFSTCPDILEQYQNRFHYIMVDEYQDTNTSQYQLVRLLAGTRKNVCVVGDDDQSIYGWRGANIRNILDFEKDYPAAKTIRLEQNYRSTKVILQAANDVISNNLGRKVKELWTENDEGHLVVFTKSGTDYEEGLYIADKIVELVNEEGREYKDFAILYRANALSRALEEQLVKRSVPYRLFGGVNFYGRKEIKDIISYLKLIMNPADGIALQRVINVPKRGIGDSTVQRIATFAFDNGMSIYQALWALDEIPGVSARKNKLLDFRYLIEYLREYAAQETVMETVKMLLERTGYLKELEEEQSEEAEGRIENLQSLISKAADYDKEAGKEGTLEEFLEEISLVADVDQYAEQENTVSLMTLHSSKGLEFPYVFLAGFEDGVFPSYRSVFSGEEKDLEEERRLCYVGITRAKEVLYLTAASSRRQNGQMVYNSVSRFLKEISPQLIMEETKVAPPQAARQPEPPKRKFSRTPVYVPNKENYRMNQIQLIPKNVSLDFEVGDSVRQMKYGVGVVKEIRPAGADYEVTVEFERSGRKKFMAGLSKLKKA